MESNTPIVNVLDHGFVRLVSYMQPVPTATAITEEGVVNGRRPGEWTGDLEIVRNARVSYDADWRTGDDAGADERLVHYMYENQHTSPFEAMVFTFEVQVPIFITRQWHRHRTWSYNEVSARYAPLPDVFFLPEPEHIGTQSTSSKQASDFNELTEAERIERESHIATVGNNFNRVYRLYEELIESGWPRERARTVLPVGIYTRFFATVDLHNLFHFLRLRLHEHAQYEIRVYAEAMLDLIDPIVPIAVDAFIQRRAEDLIIEKLRALAKKQKWNTGLMLGKLHNTARQWADNENES